MGIQVRDFMHQPVVSCALPTDVGHVRDLMQLKEVHALPLVEIDDQNRITIRGIVTSHDLMGVYDDNVDIRQVMTEKVHVVSPDSGAAAAANMMLRHQTHHLVAMEDGKIVGMLSSMDFVRLVAEN